jgi:hypothetical protein
MTKVRRLGALMHYVIFKFRKLGARTLIGCASALVAAVLIFCAPEVGVVGAAGGVMFGVISAVLVHPH